jgi:chromosome segregation ATPase
MSQAIAFLLINALMPEADQNEINQGQITIENGGAWLTPAHLQSIEQALANIDAQSADAVATLNAQVAALNTSIETLTQAAANVSGELADAQAALGHRDAEVDALKLQIDELKKLQAGTFTPTTRANDDAPVIDRKAKYHTSYDAEAERYTKK